MDEPVGDNERKLNRLDCVGDCGRPPVDCSELRIERRKLEPSFDGRTRLKLLLLSPELVRRRTGTGRVISFLVAPVAATALPADAFLTCLFIAT